MKFFIPFASTLILGSVVDSLTTRDEFIKKAKLISNKLVRSIKPKKVQCTEDLKLKKGGPKTCYGFAVGTPSSVFNQSIYDPDHIVSTIHTPENSLLNGMFYHFGNFDIATTLMRYPGVNYMMMLMEEEPKCEPVILSANKVGPILSGPADMLMLQSHAVADMKEWTRTDSKSISPPLPFNAGISLGIDESEFKSIESVSERVKGTKFGAGPNQECTPFLVRVAHKCNRSAISLVLSKNNGVIAMQRHFKKATTKHTFLLPVNGVDKDTAHTLAGCVTD